MNTTALKSALIDATGITLVAMVIMLVVDPAYVGWRSIIGTFIGVGAFRYWRATRA